LLLASPVERCRSRPPRPSPLELRREEKQPGRQARLPARPSGAAGPSHARTAPAHPRTQPTPIVAATQSPAPPQVSSITPPALTEALLRWSVAVRGNADGAHRPPQLCIPTVVTVHTDRPTGTDARPL